ncbi:SLC13 family permease [Ferruginivarius sediminum]|uniref:SLC13 family permease n=1 Tax=Ferruginivarius sediminum TaxID=2661937 RepID=A0A369TBD1_9PROT|nr:SLC13 family permease [Ferruginivarius sediminum]RDD61487.1 SLC13 family permease [Ferruginivarius sediminum]
MTTEQIMLFAILATALLLFAWGRWRYDVVAVAALLAAVVLGIVPMREAFQGFGHPAVITVVGVLILSRSLRNSGLIEWLTRVLRPTTGRPTSHIMALSGLTAACSAFMNNVGAMALILPVALQSSHSSKRPASMILMPLSFASLLGGLITLIGTPPNIIIASYRGGETGEAFGMFDFSPVGLGVAAAGVAFVSLLGWRLLPTERQGEVEGKSLFQLEDYITEVRLPEGSSYVGRRLVELETLAQGDVAVVALVRRKDRMLAPSGYLRLQAGDILIIESDTAALQRLAKQAGLDMVGEAELSAENLRSERVGLVEVVVTPGSRLEGRTARSLRLHTRYGLNLLGVARQGHPITERLGQVRFLAGDVLLLQGERDAMPEAFQALGCLPLAERELPLGRRGTSATAPLIFAGAIGLVAFGVLPPHIAFILAVLVQVLTNAISVREIYDAVEWPIVILLGAMLPVGQALEATGGTAVISDPILGLAGSVPPWGILTLLMMVTMLLSDIMNNAATAVLMAPIGVSIAQGLGVSIDPFLMGVAIACSSTYLTPIGHQSNLLVMGPGGYKFGDYWRMGLPLDALILIVAVPLILQVWPL